MVIINHKRNLVTALVFMFLAFSGYLYSNLPVQSTGYNSLAGEGKIIWQEQNCNSCHQIYGLGGFLGPDITNIYSLRGADHIKAFVINGTPVMPRFNLRDKDMMALLAFLKEVDKSGNSDPRSFRINNNGTIEKQ